MLVTSVFIIIFVVSSIAHENAYALLAVIVLSVLVVVRVIYYAVSLGFIRRCLFWQQHSVLQRHAVTAKWCES